MRIINFIIMVIVIWIFWASISTGGLYELEQINPNYVQQDRSLAYLVSKVNYSSTNGFWDNYHVEMCSLYMPDWNKAEDCVKARVACESESPKMKDDREHADIFSDSFQHCWTESRPFFGPAEWLRFSRGIWRIVIMASAFKIMGGFNNNEEQAVEWDKKNKWWAQSLLEWVDKAK